MRVLVTGSTGFVGGALVAKLLDAEGIEVRGSVRRLSDERERRQVEIVVGDLGPDTSWQSVLKGVDTVVHTAARVHVMRESRDAALENSRRVNVEGTANLARQAVQAGVSRFVFLSSIKVNGEKTATGRPFTETDSPDPVDPYGMSKLEAEQGLMEICAGGNMEYVILRPVLVYGPGVSANFEALMRAIYRGTPLPIAGIDNRRSMIGLENLIDMIIACVQSPAAANNLFLAADGYDISTTELAIKLGEALQRPARLFHLPDPLLRGAAMLLGRRTHAERLLDSLQADVSKAKMILQWQPGLTVEQGFRNAAASFLASREQ
jgi:nucleoside-diphosphate-sugar epimerase